MRRFAASFSLLALFATSPLHADSATEDLWLAKLAVAEDPMEEESEASKRFLASVERNALTSAKGRAERKADKLIFTLLDGKKLELSDLACSDEGERRETDCHSYQFMADLPSRHAFLLRKVLYEGFNFLSVDDRTGTQTKIAGIPMFSEKGDKFVEIDNDYAYGNVGSIAIWSLASGRPEIEWQLADADSRVFHLSRVVRWKGDRIDLLFWTLEWYGHPEQSWPAALIHDANGWHLETNWPEDLR